MSTIYDVNGMKSIAKNYVQRMHDASGNGTVDLNKESLLVKIDKATLDSLSADPKFDGLFAIFALNDESSYETQSVLLVPYDGTGKAMKTNGKMEGVERFPFPTPRPPKLMEIIFPNGSGQPDIDQGIDDAFIDLGIV